MVRTFGEGHRVPGNRIAAHRHDHYEIFLIRGRGVFQSDFVSHPLEGENMFFVSPGQVHAWEKEPMFRGGMVAFSQSFFDGAAPPPSRLLEYPFFYGEPSAHVLPLPKGAWQSMESLLTQMEREWQADEYGSDEVIRALLNVLLIQASRLHKAEHGAGFECPRDQLFRRFAALVEHRFGMGLTVVEFASALGVSANHLNETVRRAAGVSAGQFVRQRIVLEAQRLLVYSDQSAAEIGYALGFEDPAYFSRFLRRETGKTPLEVRETSQKSAKLKNTSVYDNRAMQKS